MNYDDIGLNLVIYNQNIAVWISMVFVLFFIMNYTNFVFRFFLVLLKITIVYIQVIGENDWQWIMTS